VLYYEPMSLSIESKYVRLISSRLRNFKQKNDYLWNFSCPICGDSQKNKSKARGYVFQKGTNLFYRCHNCGISTNVGNLIKSVDPSLHKEYVLERYKSGESGFSNFKEPTFNIPSPRFGKVEKTKVFENAEWVDKLPSGHFCLTYVESRKLPKEVYTQLLFTPHFKQFADEVFPNHGKDKLVDDARLVILFHDQYDELVGISGRALETSDYKLRYIKVRSQDTQDKLVYGMDKVDTNKLVKVVEGEFDSMFLDNCIASGDSSLHITADLIETENKVLIFDNEPRNKEIVKLQSDAIKLGYNVVIWPDTIQEKDINDMVKSGLSHDEIETIISSNTFSGLQAQTKFVFWKKV